jgi:hypothetical protein
MPDDPPRQFQRNDQVGKSAVNGIAMVRLGSFLTGAAVLAVILAIVYRGFLGNHPGLAVLFAVAYVAVCAVGAYFKVAPSKPSASS